MSILNDSRQHGTDEEREEWMQEVKREFRRDEAREEEREEVKEYARDYKRRRRICNHCGCKFTTHETVYAITE